MQHQAEGKSYVLGGSSPSGASACPAENKPLLQTHSCSAPCPSLGEEAKRGRQRVPEGGEKLFSHAPHFTATSGLMTQICLSTPPLPALVHAEVLACPSDLSWLVSSHQLQCNVASPYPHPATSSLHHCGQHCYPVCHSCPSLLTRTSFSGPPLQASSKPCRFFLHPIAKAWPFITVSTATASLQAMLHLDYIRGPKHLRAGPIPSHPDLCCKDQFPCPSLGPCHPALCSTPLALLSLSQQMEAAWLAFSSPL